MCSSLRMLIGSLYPQWTKSVVLTDSLLVVGILSWLWLLPLPLPFTLRICGHLAINIPQISMDVNQQTNDTLKIIILLPPRSVANLLILVSRNCNEVMVPCAPGPFLKRMQMTSILERCKWLITKYGTVSWPRHRSRPSRDNSHLQYMWYQSQHQRQH